MLFVMDFGSKSKNMNYSLREKDPNAELFWSAFSCIRTEYGDLRSNIRIQSKYTGKCGPEITLYLDTFHVVILVPRPQY